MKISATIITYNEEEYIASAIKSLDWADEIVVVDSESVDKTVEIAESLGAKVITQKWLGFGKQKQFAVDSAENDWIFSLDADEVVSDELRQEILKLKDGGIKQLADGYKISRQTFYMNQPIKHSGWYPDRKLRFYNRTKGFWKEMLVHESVQMSNDAKVELINKDILHYSIKNASHHHQMIGERYAPLSAEEMFQNGRTTTAIKIMTIGFTTFVKSYILKQGFRDGLAGFCISRFAAHHAFLKHLLLWEKQQKSKNEK